MEIRERYRYPDRVKKTLNKILRWCLIAAPVFTIALFLGYSALLYSKDFPLLPPNPSRVVAKTAISIWNENTVVQAEYYASYHERLERSRVSPAPVLQDEFALSPSGLLYPKHSILISLLAAPWYGLFGIVGLWAFNEVCALLSLFFLYGTARQLSSREASAALLLLSALGTQTIFNSYGFHYDLLGFLLVSGAVFFLGRSSLWSGLLLGISPLIRVNYLLFLVCMPLVARFFEWNGRAKFRSVEYCAGAGAGLFLTGLLNYLMWGSPFSTAYHRLPMFIQGSMVIDSTSHFDSFSLHAFFSDWSSKLFDSQAGLLEYNPLLWVALPCAVTLLILRPRSFAAGCALVAALNLCLMFSSENWRYSVFGNRFAFPSLGLISLSLLFPLERLLNRWRVSV